MITEGDGSLEWTGGRVPVRAGDTALVPYAAGDITAHGVMAVVCRPPAAIIEEES